LGALVIALALIVAGCGGGSSSSSSGSSSSGSTESEGSGTPAKSEETAPSAELSGKPYIIGGLTPLSGEGYNYPEWVAGGFAAVEAINAEGGIDGHPVEYFNCDDKNNPNEATKCAKEMVSKGVIGVAGGASLFPDDITTVLKEADIPWVGAFAETKAQFNDENEFPIDSSLLSSGAGSAIALNAKGIKSAAAAHFEIPQSTIHYEAFNHAVETVGMELQPPVGFPISATDMTPYVQKMINEGPEGVGLFATQLLVANFIKTSGQLGAEFTFAFDDGSLTPENITDIGASFKALVAGGLPPVTAGETDPSKYPGVVEFNENMEALANTGEKYAEKQHISYHTLRTWLATKVIAQVANEMKGEITGPAMTEALNAAENIETGVIPPWTPGGNTGPAGYKRLSNPDIWLSEINSEGEPELFEGPLNVVELAELK
jgi:branched-chain amino acid transport system substrate-binding protein